MSPQINAFYRACCKGDFKIVREAVNRFEIDVVGPNGNTALHTVSMHGHVKLVQLLLRYGASRTILNDDGCNAKEIAANEQTTEAFEHPVRPISDSNHFVALTCELQWLDSYKNAYRISHENHERMRQWLTKIPLQKLLKEIDTGYIDKLNFAKEEHLLKIKHYFLDTIELEDPLALLQAYTSPSVQFHHLLNRDLAKFGSDFRFIDAQASIRSCHADNEPPKDLGQYIFAAILINHPRFRRYQHAATTFRGMKITQKDLEEYNIGNIFMTRSFLSTSEDRDIAELFLDCADYETNPSVICIYKVTNARSSLLIKEVSQIPAEEEVLIVPFTVFQVKEQQSVQCVRGGLTCFITEIQLEECNQNII